MEEILIPPGTRSAPLDERLRDAVALRRREPAHYERPLAEARRTFTEARPLPPEGFGDGISAHETTIPGPAGPIPVRIYRADGAPVGVPVVVYFHGGGFVLGDLHTHERVCRAYVRVASAVVISVDYRLAPEHPYPAAIEDGFAALRWIAANAATIGGDPSRIVVAGDSAGGMLTLATALQARDAGGPILRAIVPFYPMASLVDIGEGPSYRAFGNGDSGLSIADVEWFVDCYCAPERRREPYASPRFAELAGLPPTLIALAEHDALHDEGRALAEALDRAGVPTTLIEIAGVNHGSLSLDISLPAIDSAYERIGEWLRPRLA